MGLYRSKNITSARKTLQKWMGLYVRLRDTDPETLDIECITCGKVHKFGGGMMNAGHWIEADIDSTRAIEWNVNAQCIRCNQMANGMAYAHGEAIKLKYGEDIYLELLELSKNDVTLDIEQTMELARQYKQMAEELAQQKGIEL